MPIEKCVCHSGPKSAECDIFLPAALPYQKLAISLFVAINYE